MSDLTQALFYARTMFQRAFLALAASLYAIFTALGPDLSTFAPGCDAAHLPHSLVLPPYYKWIAAAVFGLNAGCLWWRIFDRTARVAWATVINLTTAGLWLTVTVASVFIYHEVWSENVGEIMLTLTALFVLTRTDLTAIDKGTA
jgi:hypothetical protein